MSRLFFTLAFFAFIVPANAQDAKMYYEEGVAKAKLGEMEEAIQLFDKSILADSTEPIAWFNRGICKSILRRDAEALIDLEMTVKLNPDFLRGYLIRGQVKKKLTDYDGALADYNHILTIDNNHPEAYYQRATVYELLSDQKAACADFEKALSNGMKDAQRKMDACKNKDSKKTYPIPRLTKTSSDPEYGFNSAKPIKVGNGPDGGPANQRAYLNLLRDAQGKPVQYERIGGCCPYKSANALVGDMALVDHYKITFLDEKNNTQTKSVYISFYDYEDPMILTGFKTIVR